MDDTLDAIELTRQKFEQVHFFDGVLRCLWAEMAIEQGADQLDTQYHVAFYGWSKQ